MALHILFFSFIFLNLNTYLLAQPPVNDDSIHNKNTTEKIVEIYIGGCIKYYYTTINTTVKATDNTVKSTDKTKLKNL